MLKPLSKVIVITFMLIAFVGQTLAYAAMSCEMATGTHQSHQMMGNNMIDNDTMAHDMMEHATMGHSMTDDLSADHQRMNHQLMSDLSQSDDCCEVDCHCPANACTSTTLLYAPIDLSNIQSLSDVVITLTTQQPKSVSTSLYRPPIIA
ncbi:hypothetical protein [Thalassotalea ganghwensis]